MVDDNFRCHQRLKMLSTEFGKKAQQTGGSQKTVFSQLGREIFGAMDALRRSRIVLEYSPRWVDVLNPATNQLVTKVPQSTQQVLNNHQFKRIC